MKHSRLKTGSVVINILIATVISLIVNFSYFVLFILSTTSSQSRRLAPPDSSPWFMAIEVIFYILLAFILLTIFTHRIDRLQLGKKSFPLRLLLAVIITMCVYFFIPYVGWHGELHFVMTDRRIFNPMVVLKCSFTLVVVALYGKIYELLGQQQKFMIEYERLKTENLRSRYDVLINQMNPHFFFNSLNSLSMLVRENKNEDALNYIDRLSDTFRYIIQSGQSSMTTLREEITFLDSYKYLLEIRYAGKLFIDVDIPAEYMDMTLPSLTLQPLVENAVKHNIITKSMPLHVTITVSGNNLLVSNPYQPKIDASTNGTGIGLKNIASRYKLLTDKDISVIDDHKTFSVKLPLSPARN